MSDKGDAAREERIAEAMRVRDDATMGPPEAATAPGEASWDSAIAKCSALAEHVIESYLETNDVRNLQALPAAIRLLPKPTDAHTVCGVSHSPEHVHWLVEENKKLGVKAERVGPLRDALILARSYIEQGNTLQTLICANGPSMREVIERALKGRYQ